MPFGYGVNLKIVKPGVYPVGAGEAIGTAFRIYGRHFGKFFLYWLLAGVLVSGINAIPFFLQVGLQPEETGSNAIMGVGAFIPLISMGLLILFSAGLISMTREALEKGKVSILTGFAPFVDNAGMVILTTFAVYFIVLIGLFLCIIPGLVFCYWYFFAVAAVVLEKRTMIAGLRRSKEFSRDHGALGFILLLIFMIILLSIVVFGVSLAGWSLYYGPENFLAAICFGIIISPILLWFVSPIGFIATGVYFIKGTGMVVDHQVIQSVGGGYQQPPVPNPDQVYQHYYQPPQ